MNHYSTGADPYDAGAALGRALRADGLSPGQAHLPALSAEKRDFGEKSARICAAEYPSLLAEIRGLADGLKMPFSDLAAFLFGIYNFPPFQGCTCFAAQGEGGEVIFGRNSDFLTMFEPYDASFHYTISGKHAFVGNSTAPVQIEDGVNEFGLAAGLTFLWPVVKKPGLNAGMLVRYLLEHCKTVREAIGALREFTISSSQTITLADAMAEWQWWNATPSASRSSSQGPVNASSQPPTTFIPPGCVNTAAHAPTIFSRGCVTGLRARRSNPGRGTIFPLPKTCFQANSDSSASMTAASGPIPSGRLSVCCGRGGFSAARATHPGMNGARTSG